MTTFARHRGLVFFCSGFLVTCSELFSGGAGTFLNIEYIRIYRSIITEMNLYLWS